MNTIEHIRKNVLCVTQSALATIAGVNQATVSRWERGDAHPNLGDIAKIRQAIVSRGIEWDDTFWFDSPPESVE